MDKSSEDPGYLPQQIADWLSLRITSGSLKPGDPVPSADDLVARFRVTEQTAESALRSLRTDGLVEIDLDKEALVVAARAIEAAQGGDDGPVTASSAELQEIRGLLAQVTRGVDQN